MRRCFNDCVDNNKTPRQSRRGVKTVYKFIAPTRDSSTLLGMVRNIEP